MSLAGPLFMALYTVAGTSLPAEQLLDFETPTLRLVDGPSVPAGWRRICDTLELADGRGSQHGRYPRYVGIEHRADGAAKSGEKYLRIHLAGAPARIETDEPLILDDAFGYTFGGYYRWCVPAQMRLTDPAAARTRLLFEVRDEAGGLLAASSADISPGSSDWQPLLVCRLAAVPAGTARIRVALEIQGGDYAGWLDLDGLYMLAAPRVSIVSGRPADVFEVGEPAALALAVSGFPEDAAEARVQVRDAAGAVVHSESVALKPSAGAAHFAVAVPSEQRGWFRADVAVSGRGGAVATGQQAYAVAAAGRRSPRLGVLLDATGGLPAALDSGVLAPGFAVLKVAADVAEALKVAERLRPRRLTCQVWLAAAYDEVRVLAAVERLAPYASGWLIPQDYPADGFMRLIERAGAAGREVLQLDAAGQAAALVFGGAAKHTDLAILPAADGLVWRIAALKAAGVNRIACELPAAGAPPAAVLAAAYWGPRIMEATFEAASEVAPGVQAMLFNEASGGLVLFRAAGAAEQVAFTLPGGTGVRARDEAGNAYPPARRSGLDVVLVASRKVAALDGVDARLLKTAMSFSVQPATLVSAYEYQPVTVGFTNHLPEGLSLSLLPTVAAGWRFKPAFSERALDVPAGGSGSVSFRVRPAMTALCASHALELRVYPRSFAGDSFTVRRRLELASPLQVSARVASAGEGSVSVALSAALVADFGRPLRTLEAQVRTPAGVQRTFISGLIPGGRSSAAREFVLPVGASAYPAEIWLTERAGGVFYNSSITVAAPAHQ